MDSGQGSARGVASPTEVLDLPVIDIHQHVGDMPVVSGRGAGTTEENLRRRVAFMDEWGIDQAVILPSNAGPAPAGAADRTRSNDLVASYIATAPDRFPTGAGTVHPADGELAMVELERCMTELAFCGMVWHHRFLGVAIDHPGMHLLLERLEELGGVAFIHLIPESGMEAPWRLEILAEAHPELTFVALDGFASFQSASWMLHIARRHPNIVFDTGAATSIAHRFLDFVTEFGPERLLLGTDFYCEPFLFGLPFPLVEIRDHLGLPADTVEAVLGGNAARVLGLPRSA
jgi:hypothetical protein